jgi:hypothetical protein
MKSLFAFVSTPPHMKIIFEDKRDLVLTLLLALRVDLNDEIDEHCDI